MEKLADTSLVGGERMDATDYCLAWIARLSNEVKDAASYIPTYDQRIYAEVRPQPCIGVFRTVSDGFAGYKDSPGQVSGDSSDGRATT